MMEKMFARITGGSLSKGIEAHILRGFSPEDVRASSIVVVSGAKNTYLALISDLQLKSGSDIAEALVRSEDGASNDLRVVQEVAAEGLKREGVLGAEITLIPIAVYRNGAVERADNIPELMSRVRIPSIDDVESFYGRADCKRLWNIGKPKAPIIGEDLAVFVPINVDVLVRGCFGIFGKSGTGKTFLGNLIATYIILANHTGAFEKKVKLLILDMHSEYGLKVKDQLGEEYADGVGLAFKYDFLRLTPDEILSRESGLDMFMLSYRGITVEDLIASGEALGFTRTFMDLLPSIAGLLKGQFKDDWLKALCGFISDREDEQVRKEVRERYGQGALMSLLSARGRLARLARYEFIKWDDVEVDTASTVVSEILDGGRSVVISFGRYGDDRVAYMLIANILARRLWSECIKRIMAGKKLKYRVVIFLEEAHKFLGPSVYFMTPFGNIARELRKRGVVLCIIDQRPSQIFEDARAMLWNNFVMCLTEDSDIEAASKGLPHPKLFKPVIERLRRKEVLVFGEAISVPSVVAVRDYGEAIEEAKKLYSELVSSEESVKIGEMFGYGRVKRGST
ncbi:MAG: ATP-binding protein [archaeon GB-1867-005]|nr:ATP-binding protein [Candidatus Culexmicrobium cathedralense]